MERQKEEGVQLIDVLKKNGEEHLYDQIVALIMNDNEVEDDYYDGYEEDEYYDVCEVEYPSDRCALENMDDVVQAVQAIDPNSPMEQTTTRTTVMEESPKEYLLLEDVLKKNGEEHLYIPLMALSKGAEEDPPLIFACENVETFVEAFNAVQGEVDPAPPSPPPGLILHPNMSVHDFKVALLNFVKMEETITPLGTTALPCDIGQCARCAYRLGRLHNNPWIRYVITQQQQQPSAGGNTDTTTHNNNPNRILPIAIVCVPRPGTNVLNYAIPHTPDSMDLWR